MAIGLKSDFINYDDMFHTFFTERLAQRTNIMNAASGGSIKFSTVQRRGEYDKETFFKLHSGLLKHRDDTSMDPITSERLQQAERVGVKVKRGSKPVEHSYDALENIDISYNEFIQIISEQLADLAAKDYSDTAIKCLKNAMAAQSAMTLDVTSETPSAINYQHLVRLMQKYGDRQDEVVAFAMHSATWADLGIEGITNQKFDAVAGAKIVGGTTHSLGKPVIILDSEGFVDTSGATDKYAVMALTQDALNLEQNGSERIAVQEQVGLENISFKYQTEYSFWVKMKGMAWDVTSGGANPNDAALTTGTNWDKVVTDNKDLPASLLICSPRT